MTISHEYAEELGRQIDELEAENERLREALTRISDWCPATQEMTLAHQMAQEAEEALA